MAFLGNDGDIILDAVLTDAGRKRLAAGDGTFRISKFALGDDEINYALYDSTNANGSAYYDLDLLKTPVFEAITHSGAGLSSKLLTIPNSELLFLPLLKLNVKRAPLSSLNNYILVVNDTLAEALTGGATLPNYRTIFSGQTGYIDGRSSAKAAETLTARVDQGLDNQEAGGAGTAMLESLEESRYLVSMDNRFCELTSVGENPEAAEIVYVSADKTSTYYISSAANPEYFAPAPSKENTNIAGPVGRQFQFSIKGSPSILNNTEYLFNTYGRSVVDYNGTGETVNVIDTNIKIQGGTQGSTINIPVQLVSQ
jgi:hypothetical protein